MNEKIKELWVKAQDNTINDPYNELLVERFANLIIKECCRIADENLDQEWPAGEIAKHFGVEYE